MAVNKVEFGDEVVMDITDSTVNAQNLAKGEIAYGPDGEKIVGEATYVPQLKELPTESDFDVVQYIGTDTESVKHGYFYEFKNGAWGQLDVQPQLEVDDNSGLDFISRKYFINGTTYIPQNDSVVLDFTKDMGGGLIDYSDCLYGNGYVEFVAYEGTGSVPFTPLSTIQYELHDLITGKDYSPVIVDCESQWTYKLELPKGTMSSQPCISKITIFNTNPDFYMNLVRVALCNLSKTYTKGAKLTAEEALGDIEKLLKGL